MKKNFSKIEIAVIKRTAQNVAQFVNKKEKLNAEIEKVKASKEDIIAEIMAKASEKADARIANKVAKLTAEIATLQPIIDSFQSPIKNMTDGYTTEDLVIRETVHTGKIDANTGKEICQTRYVLRYPETVVPPVYNTAEEEPKAEEQVEAEMPSYGNDFDKDVEVLGEDFNDENSAEHESADPFANDWQ
jgi:seryl-tRNA synthetase